MVRYAELHPDRLQAALDRQAPAVIAWGALEWHGDHLPLGLDGIVAEWFAGHLATRIQGVLLPPIWLPMTTLPHPISLQVSTHTFKAILRESIDGLADVGFKSICIVTGHYAQGHLYELFVEAISAMERHPGLRVLSGPPLAVLHDDSMLDHAGRHETSQLLAIRPDLVRIESLQGDIDAKRDAVLGADPRQGSVEEGREELEAALQAWIEWTGTATLASLKSLYESWQADLEPYRAQFYKSSWEQAILDWWATK